MLITWRSTWEVVRRLLHNLANVNYVKRLLMDPLHWRMDPQYLRNWWGASQLDEVQVSGAPAEHTEHWKAPEIVESALKYTTITFRKAFNSNSKRDILQRLKDPIYNMRPIIEGQTWVNTEAVKWYLSLNINFGKSTSPIIKTDPAVTFSSEVFKSIDTHKLDYQFHAEYNQIVLQTDEFQHNGSGWIVDHLQHLDLGTCFL